MRSRDSAFALALLLGGCGRAPKPALHAGDALPPVSASARYEQAGVASWYGEEVGGRPTASGDLFDPGAFTAAHRTLPLGSVVEVVSRETGRVVRVLVNDRGPRDPARLIDLSRAAAQAIGTDRHALAPVRVRLVQTPDQDQLELGALPFAGPAKPTRRAAAPVAGGIVQVASFISRPRAGALADRLGGSVEQAGAVYRVRLGPFRAALDAQRARDDAVARGYGDAAIFPPN